MTDELNLPALDLWVHNQKRKSNLDYLEYRCNVRDTPFDGWETVLAISPVQAALIYYEIVGKHKACAEIFVLRPAEIGGVDRPDAFQVKHLLALARV